MALEVLLHLLCIVQINAHIIISTHTTKNLYWQLYSGKSLKILSSLSNLKTMHGPTCKNDFENYLGITTETCSLTLCSPSSTFGTSACSPDSTFGTNTGAVHNELYPIILHLSIQWHHLGPVSQRVAINHTIDINCSSMANRILRKLAINRNPLWNGALEITVNICRIPIVSYTGELPALSLLLNFSIRIFRGSLKMVWHSQNSVHSEQRVK